MKMSRFHNKRGMTLVEMLLATLLISVVFLAVSALYIASQRFCLTANDKVIILYELQYAADHIYKNVMMGIGDETSTPGSRAIKVPDDETLNVEINNYDPLDSTNYGTTVTYSYSKSGDELFFNDGSGSDSLSLIPKVTVAGVAFSLDGNLLTISLIGSYKEQTLTFYSACYPRLASFN